MDVRLAYFPLPAVDETLSGPAVRLAYGVLGREKAVTGAMTTAADAPALLVSYVYLPQFKKVQPGLRYRDWVLDSGAFSAFKSGTSIDLDGYIEECKTLLATDPTLTEVYALDVIGDWKATLRNTDKMWAEGVPAIPCYHLNEPQSYLKELARRFPKIALGGVAATRGKQKRAWASWCFGVVWPKKIHGFGFGSRGDLMALPFHSVDATNWELGPCAFGNWKTFGKLSLRGSKQNLRAEVEYYLRMEREARGRWRKEMALLEDLGPTVRLAMTGTMTTKSGKDALADPTVCLAVNGPRAEAGSTEKALGPEVRLAVGGNSLQNQQKKALWTPEAIAADEARKQGEDSE